MFLLLQHMVDVVLYFIVLLIMFYFIILFLFSVFIAGFPEYTQGVIDHLADVKIAHWDR